MRILSIETSCDETAIALLECSGGLVEPSFKVLANALISQIDIHKEYGGVFPMLAKREHEKNLPILLEKIAKDLTRTLCPPSPNLGEGWERFIWDMIDFIAVTEGPGLEPALWTGIVFAEELGRKWDKPVVGANHMEGHILSVLLGNGASTDAEQAKILFPALALLVSGGHTEIVHMKDYGEYEVVGKTRDDAVGEAFDKVARLLGLPYPGGPKISVLAEIDRAKHAESKITFPRPMIRSGDLDFSFSGLKTSVMYMVKEMNDLSEDQKENLARAFEDAAVDVLTDKTERAFERFEAKSLILGGGVSANRHLSMRLEELALKLGVPLLKPVPELTGDNAVMIGMAGYIEAEIRPELLARPSTALRARGTLSL